MPKALAPGQYYAGRGPGVTPVQFSLDTEAVVLLRQLAPSAKGYGRFLSRLIYEHAERQRIVGKLTGVLAEELAR